MIQFFFDSTRIQILLLTWWKFQWTCIVLGSPWKHGYVQVMHNQTIALSSQFYIKCMCPFRFAGFFRQLHPQLTMYLPHSGNSKAFITHWTCFLGSVPVLGTRIMYKMQSRWQIRHAYHRYLLLKSNISTSSICIGVAASRIIATKCATTAKDLRVVQTISTKPINGISPLTKSFQVSCNFIQV